MDKELLKTMRDNQQKSGSLLARLCATLITKHPFEVQGYATDKIEDGVEEIVECKFTENVTVTIQYHITNLADFTDTES